MPSSLEERLQLCQVRHLTDAQDDAGKFTKEDLILMKSLPKYNVYCENKDKL